MVEALSEDSESKIFLHAADLTEVTISTSVGGFYADFGSHCCLLADAQNIQEGNRNV
jgi:hypothetical protein